MLDAVSDEVRKAVGPTANRIAGRLENTAVQVHQAAGRAHAGVGDAIRAQPIIAALAAFALGCIVGGLGSVFGETGRRKPMVIPRDRRIDRAATTTASGVAASPRSVARGGKRRVRSKSSRPAE
jgi:hypothetical protein